MKNKTKFAIIAEKTITDRNQWEFGIGIVRYDEEIYLLL